MPATVRCYTITNYGWLHPHALEGDPDRSGICRNIGEDALPVSLSIAPEDNRYEGRILVLTGHRKQRLRELTSRSLYGTKMLGDLP